MTTPYDNLYKQMDVMRKPFSYSWDYLIWRNKKIKGEITKFIDKNGSIVDIDGGFGMMTQFLPKFVNKDVNYLNTDISITMLKYTPYQNICAAGEQLPFRNNIFDYVVCSEVLEHVYDKQKVLSEAYRVLRFGGLFLLTTPRTGWIKDFRKSPFLVFLILDYVANLIKNKLLKWRMS